MGPAELSPGFKITTRLPLEGGEQVRGISFSCSSSRFNCFGAWNEEYHAFVNEIYFKEWLLSLQCIMISSNRLTYQIFPFMLTSSGDTWKLESLNVGRKQLTNWKTYFVMKLRQYQRQGLCERWRTLGCIARRCKQLNDLIFNKKKNFFFFFYRKIQFWIGSMFRFLQI